MQFGIRNSNSGMSSEFDEFRIESALRIPSSEFPVPTGAAASPSISRVTDAELVEQARLGDAAAFGELVRRHQAAVVRTARVVCRSREDAEDVAQEALVSAWNKLAPR
jgi:hypothetical protein